MDRLDINNLTSLKTSAAIKPTSYVRRGKCSTAADVVGWFMKTEIFFEKQYEAGILSSSDVTG